MASHMAGPEPEGQNPEARIILIGSDKQPLELETPSGYSPVFLAGIRTVLAAAIDNGFLLTNPFVMDSVPTLQLVPEQEAPEEKPAGSELTIADLRTPKHFQDYFVYRMGMFLGKEVSLSLPSQEHVDRGQRIKDAGLSTFEPVVFPNLTIVQGFQYPQNWKFPLDPWIYQQIGQGNLKSDVLNMEETWGWLDVSERLNWQNSDPMFDPKTDKVLIDLLSGLRAKGKRNGVEVTKDTKHLNSGSLFGISAVEAKTKVYSAIAGMIGVKAEEVVDLTAAQINFIGNWLYPHLGEKYSWEWIRNSFGVGRQLVAGNRGGGGLGGIDDYPSVARDGVMRPRPLVLSPSAT